MVTKSSSPSKEAPEEFSHRSPIRADREMASETSREERRRTTRVDRLGVGLSTSLELLRGLWRGGHGWLLPLVLFLLPAAALFVFLQAAPLVAPFVYSVF